MTKQKTYTRYLGVDPKHTQDAWTPIMSKSTDISKYFNMIRDRHPQAKKVLIEKAEYGYKMMRGLRKKPTANQLMSGDIYGKRKTFFNISGWKKYKVVSIPKR